MAEYPKSEVLLTDKIRRWIRTVLTTSNLPDDIRIDLRKYTNNRRASDDKKCKTIPFDLVKSVHRYLQDDQGALPLPGVCLDLDRSPFYPISAVVYVFMGRRPFGSPLGRCYYVTRYGQNGHMNER